MITIEDSADEVLRRKRRKIALIAGVFLLFLMFVGALARWIQIRNRPRPVFLPAVLAKPQPKPYAPEGIVFHHSETPAKVGHTIINAARLAEINRHDHPNWRTPFEGKVYYIGYHYVILPDGTVEQGRPELCVGTHARKFNNWLGICLVGAFQGRRGWWPSSPTEAQKEALVQLSAKLIVKYHIPLTNVRRHIDVNQTNCPGTRFPYGEIMQEIREELAKTTPSSRTP